MSNAILVVGESGTGKSTSIRTLPPKETFILSVVDKPLPFKGYRKNYSLWTKENENGNYFCSDNHAVIMRIINYVNTKRPDIKYLVIDDFGFSIANDFMRKSMQKGYEKFSELAKDAFDVIEEVNKLRDDLYCFVMMHVETDNNKLKIKTAGKMIDQYVCIEGRFTYVFNAAVSDGIYKFITNNDGYHLAKSPMDLFKEPAIDNDLYAIANAIQTYNDEDIAI